MFRIAKELYIDVNWPWKSWTQHFNFYLSCCENISFLFILFRHMFTQFLNTRKDSSQPVRGQSKKDTDTEMPSEVLGMPVSEMLKMIGLYSVNANNAGCLLVLVLRLRQCCSHMSLMCQVNVYISLKQLRHCHYKNNLLVN